MIDTDKLKEGSFLKIEIAPKKEHMGLWKITDVQQRLFEEEPVWFFEVDQNESVSDDEIYVEYFPETDNRDLYIYEIFDKFPQDNAEGWPPPPVIEIDDVEYVSLDDKVDADAEIHDGFQCEHLRSGDLFQSWVYEDESGDKILQITLDKGFVTMYVGQRLNVRFVELT